MTATTTAPSLCALRVGIRQALAVTAPETWNEEDCADILAALERIQERRDQFPSVIYLANRKNRK